MANDGKVWFWYAACARGCSLVKTSPDYAGNPAWNSEACPICGAKLTVLDVPGVDVR